MDKKAVGRKIKSIRMSKGMTMEQFGEIFNAKSGVVSNWENGKQLPNKDRLKRIAELGNIAVEELISIIDYKSLYEQEVEKNLKNDNLMVAQRIKSIRRSNRLTMEQFGELFGANKSVVQRWESAHSMPSNKRLKQIAEYAGVTVDFLTNVRDYRQLYLLEQHRCESLQCEIDNLKEQIYLYENGLDS